MKPDSAYDVTLWLPPLAHLRDQLTPAMALHRLLVRADRFDVPVGDNERILRAFDVLPRGLPVAALSRQLDTGEALNFTWLRADPGFLRPDMASARLMACGDLDLSAEECDALLKPLRPLFGDEGFTISAPVPSRWYLCLPADVRLPEFSPPHDVLGDDLFAHLPDGETGVRWRRLLNEAQMLLHNNPVNEQRSAAGKLPVNTLWFWGAGRLPDHVRSAVTELRTGDVVLQALAGQAGVPVSTDNRVDSLPPGALADLRQVHQLDQLDGHWIGPLMKRVQRGDFASLMLDFGDGRIVRWDASHRWRFWRRRLPS